MKLALAALTSLSLMAASTPVAQDVYQGRPKFDQGDAFHVWNADGQWHLRWVASEQRAREFKGIVAATGGKLTNLQENNSEKETLTFLSSRRRMSVGNNRTDPGIRVPDAPSVNKAVIRPDGADKIVFEALAANAIGGFDFVPDDSVTTIQIDLLLDKRTAPAFVRLGKGSKKAGALPLVVNLVTK
ncbi:MAG TPA: hypothetical protein VM053_03350 [Gemmatimonadaceae bacterium]|nr:hypothetical protein [Gemmatimonadaceae bacterium]